MGGLLVCLQGNYVLGFVARSGVIQTHAILLVALDMGWGLSGLFADKLYFGFLGLIWCDANTSNFFW